MLTIDVVELERRIQSMELDITQLKQRVHENEEAKQYAEKKRKNPRS